MPKAKTFLKACSESFLDALYPGVCIFCDGPSERSVCNDCESKIGVLPRGLCPRCGLGDGTECGSCGWMNSLDWLRSAVNYHGRGGHVVRSLKFRRLTGLASTMSEAIAELLQAAPPHDLIVPVPIHWSRMALRGFNQADQIAENAGSARIKPEVLVRHRRTRAQAKLTLKLRRQNLVDALRSTELNGERIMLVDDVVTSGATLEACAHEFKRRGASWVGAVTYARQSFDLH